MDAVIILSIWLHIYLSFTIQNYYYWCFIYSLYFSVSICPVSFSSPLHIPSISVGFLLSILFLPSIFLFLCFCIETAMQCWFLCLKWRNFFNHNKNFSSENYLEVGYLFEKNYLFYTESSSEFLVFPYARDVNAKQKLRKGSIS